MTKIERAAGYGILSLLALIPTVECVLRLVFHTGLPNETLVITHLLLVLGLFSGMAAAGEDAHLAIGLIQYLKNETLVRRLKIITGTVSVFVTVIIAWTSASFISMALVPSKPVLFFIPDSFFALAMPLGYLVIAVRFALKTPVAGIKRVIPFAALALGTVVSFPQITRLVWSAPWSLISRFGSDMPELAQTMDDLLRNAAFFLKTPGILFIVFCTLAGMPLFTVIGGISLLLMQGSGGTVDVVANQIYTSLTGESIIAIPLFTLTGFFLSESKAGLRLVETFRAFFSWLPGGLIIVSVIICAFFTSFTGASGITILALGGILYAILSESGPYKEKFSVGLLTSSGSIGLLFPPSIPILLVAATTQTNTLHLFLGGIFPGILLALSMIIFGVAVSLKSKIPRARFEAGKAAVSLKASAFEILLPLLLLGGYFTGILSTVEIGAVSVIYVFVVEVLIRKDIKLGEVKNVFAKAMPIIGGILSILALSSALSYYIVDTQAPQNFARWMQSAIRSRVAFLIMLNIFLLAVGCLIDIFSAILIVLPLIIPLGVAYGIDPVHLGIIFLVNLEAGFLTPPVGLNLFFASYRFNKPFVEVCRYVFPFLIIQLAVVFLVTFVPFFSTFLKNLL
ncbi:MAG: TRAP transporter large permease subunit [Spirochaetaceae bacterium]|jgi:tripartite ATP-independent transporter DctM subunit|nr:TRAP transporter large permease subunit [Spirochaetaceae bacterium]